MVFVSKGNPWHTHHPGLQSLSFGALFVHLGTVNLPNDLQVLSLDADCSEILCRGIPLPNLKRLNLAFPWFTGDLSAWDARDLCLSSWNHWILAILCFCWVVRHIPEKIRKKPSFFSEPWRNRSYWMQFGIEAVHDVSVLFPDPPLILWNSRSSTMFQYQSLENRVRTLSPKNT